MKNPVYLFSERLKAWDSIAQKLRTASGIYLFLDYDGTLTPIKQTPSAAVLAPETENILEKISQLRGVQVAIITGRSMEDIQRLVRVNKIGFAANHGFNIYDNGIEWIHPQAISQIQTLSRLYLVLRNALIEVPKAYIENKQFTLSIHYRNVAPRYVRSLKSLVTKTVRSFNPTLRITPGKKVLEVRPRISWGKGYAVLEMLNTNKSRRRHIPVFVGDDETDEDVFKTLQKSGITIRVGANRSTKAQYYVKNVEEVMRLLQSIILLLSNSSPHRISEK